jgi:hypothetical protein
LLYLTRTRPVAIPRYGQRRLDDGVGVNEGVELGVEHVGVKDCTISEVRVGCCVDDEVSERLLVEDGSAKGVEGVVDEVGPGNGKLFDATSSRSPPSASDPWRRT